jgi:Icc-related predicted phosphoesterase
MSQDTDFTRKLRVAIIGDPHFHQSTDVSTNSISHISLTESGTFATNQNPWTGLSAMVGAEKISADILVCVGDISYGANQVALKKAWGELNNLASQLGAQFLASATGNHDVMSRSTAAKVAKNPARELSASVGLFEPLKQLAPPYPIVERNGDNTIEHRQLRTNYFGDNFAQVETDQFRLVVLNSCCEHGSDTHQYERGAFPKSSLATLEDALNNSPSEKVNILVCHHSPMPHSVHDLGGHDFIENGESLLLRLADHGAWFVVHGHKHHARITYSQGPSSAPIIFSAASLGMRLDSALEGMRNQFYCVDLYQRPSGALYGLVSAWDWNLGIGWHKAMPPLGGIYDGCGFGARQAIEEIAEEVAVLVPCGWEDAKEKINRLRYLAPGDMEILRRRLLNTHNVVMESDTNGYCAELLRKI